MFTTKRLRLLSLLALSVLALASLFGFTPAAADLVQTVPAGQTYEYPTGALTWVTYAAVQGNADGVIAEAYPANRAKGSYREGRPGVPPVPPIPPTDVGSYKVRGISKGAFTVKVEYTTANVKKTETKSFRVP